MASVTSAIEVFTDGFQMNHDDVAKMSLEINE